MFIFLRRGALFALLACLAAVGFAIPAVPASATVTSITSVTGCQDITAPGKYRLDADVITAPVALSDCLPIDANNVTLILNGHTITGRDQRGLSNFSGISANGSGDTILGPGTLTGFSDGIFLFGGSATVRGVTATGNFVGIELFGASNDVRGSVTTNSLFFGIVTDIGATSNTIIGNFAHGNDTTGFLGVSDLFDDSTFGLGCGSNVWRGNDFGTAIPASCIH